MTAVFVMCTLIIYFQGPAKTLISAISKWAVIQLVNNPPKFINHCFWPGYYLFAYGKRVYNDSCGGINASMNDMHNWWRITWKTKRDICIFWHGHRFCVEPSTIAIRPYLRRCLLQLFRLWADLHNTHLSGKIRSGWDINSICVTVFTKNVIWIYSFWKYKSNPRKLNYNTVSERKIYLPENEHLIFTFCFHF